MGTRLASVLLAAMAAPMAWGHSHGELADVPVEELKSVYLSCNRAARGGRLSSEGIMQCSVVYEALKWRAFGGDFERLLAWSREQPAAQSTAQ